MSTTLARSRLELIHLSGWESIVVVTGGGLACHAPRATLFEWGCGNPARGATTQAKGERMG